MLFVLVWFASGGVANNVDVGFAFVCVVVCAVLMCLAFWFGILVLRCGDLVCLAVYFVGCFGWGGLFKLV